jgi:hypothetical protein
MADPSGRAYGPPKGMTVPVIHDFACFSDARRGWPGQARPWHSGNDHVPYPAMLALVMVAPTASAGLAPTLWRRLGL